MLTEQTIEKLYQTKLNAMATALREQINNADYHALSFEEQCRRGRYRLYQPKRTP